MTSTKDLYIVLDPDKWELHILTESDMLDPKYKTFEHISLTGESEGTDALKKVVYRRGYSCRAFTKR